MMRPRGFLPVPVPVQGPLHGVAAFAALPLFAVVDAQTGRWQPGIGDPTLGGWLAVVAYLAAAVLSAGNALGARRRQRPSSFWSGLCALLVLLAVNKQFDVQTLFTQVGRDVAMAQGWYERRKVVQLVFITALGLFAVGGSALLWRSLASSWRGYRLTCVGVTLLLAYIVIRAATFHHVDVLLGVSLAGLRLSSLLELAAVGLIVLGAWRWRTALRHPEATSPVQRVASR